MYAFGAFLLLGLVLCEADQTESTVEACGEECSSNQQLLQTKRKVFSKLADLSQEADQGFEIRWLMRPVLCAKEYGQGGDLVFMPCKEKPDLHQQFQYDTSTKQIKLLQDPNLCLNEGDGTRMTRIKALECASATESKWVLKDNKIILEANPDLCLGMFSTQAVILFECSTPATNLLVGGRELKPTKGAALIRPLQEMKLCLDVAGKLSNNGQDVILWDCKEGLSKLNQLFKYSETGQLRLVGAPFQCLNIWEAKIKEGTVVKTYGCDPNGGASVDKWSLEENQIVVAANKDLCLGVGGKFEKNNKLQLVACKNKINAFHVTGEAKMDCPWKKNNLASQQPTCGDGTLGELWTCVASNHGQRTQCPTSHPKMCNAKTCPRHGTGEFCCSTDCEDEGGERPC